eukprot:gene30810-40112_t
MSETDRLLPSTPSKGLGLVSDDATVHKVKLEELFVQLNTSIDGLASDVAKEKRKNAGLNYVNPPIDIPNWLYYGYVKRNGKWLRLDCISIVPGDIVRVGKGERVPADIRLIKATACVYDCSSVMGKSDLIGMDPDKSSEAFLDSPNIAFLGYLCISGECTGVVFATGKSCLLSKLISQRAWPPSEF